MRFASWMLGFLLLVPNVPFASTQQPDSQSAQLHGKVVDEKGTPVRGAAVTVFRDAAEIAHEVTDQGGGFAFQGAPREYSVHVSAPGFAKLQSAPVPFSGDSSTQIVIPAAVSEATVGPVTDTVLGTRSSGGSRGQRENRSWELGGLLQGGLGVTENRGGFRFLSVGAHLGKVLTPEVGTGALRGNFEYAGELFPYWGAYTPTFQKVFCDADPGAASGSYTCSNPYTVGGTYTGVSVTPILLRWNFTRSRQWTPWVQGAGGLVWTNHKFPAIGNTNQSDLSNNGIHGDTSVWNFTPQFGIGVHRFLGAQRSLDFGANAVHISSASLGDRNPGVNASVQFTVGYTWWR